MRSWDAEGSDASHWHAVIYNITLQSHEEGEFISIPDIVEINTYFAFYHIGKVDWWTRQHMFILWAQSQAHMNQNFFLRQMLGKYELIATEVVESF